MKMLIGIPAYNEERMIGRVIKSLPPKYPRIEKTDILVVDDGSSDNTSQVADSLKATVVSHILNRGLGGALKTIFDYAKEGNYDLLVTFDADGQHDTKDILKLTHPIINGQTDIVVGTRWRKTRKAPISRLIINKLANLLTYLLFGVLTSDSQSGLRAFNKKAIQLINLESDGMEVSSEFFREIYRNRLKYKELPIKVKYTEYSKRKGQKISNAPRVFFQLLLRLLK